MRILEVGESLRLNRSAGTAEVREIVGGWIEAHRELLGLATGIEAVLDEERLPSRDADPLDVGFRLTRGGLAVAASNDEGGEALLVFRFERGLCTSIDLAPVPELVDASPPRLSFAEGERLATIREDRSDLPAGIPLDDAVRAGRIRIVDRLDTRSISASDRKSLVLVPDWDTSPPRLRLAWRIGSVFLDARTGEVLRRIPAFR